MTDSPAIRVTAPFPLLFGYVALGFALLASFLWLPDSRAFWLGVDERVFRWANASLADPGAWQSFWAIANSRLFDLVPAVMMLGLFASWMFAEQGRHWRARAGLGFALAAFTLLWVQKIVKPLLDDGRLSPTLALPDPVRLERAVAWVPMVKDHALDSFPGDHAGVSLLVALVIGHVCGWKRGVLLLAALPLFMAPRVFGGAHWFSDQAAGGGFIGLVGAGLFLGLTRAYARSRELRTAR